MRQRLTLIMLLGIFVAAQSVSSAQEKKAEPKQVKATVNKEEIIAKIAKYHAEGEQKIVDNKFSRKTVALTGDNVRKRSSRNGKRWTRIMREQSWSEFSFILTRASAKERKSST